MYSVYLMYTCFHITTVYSQGARSVEEEERERVKEKSKAFKGAGFRLGDTEESSPQIGGSPIVKEREKVCVCIPFFLLYI